MTIEKEKILESLEGNENAIAAFNLLFEQNDKSSIENEALKTANEVVKTRLDNTAKTLNDVKTHLQSAGYDGESDISEFFNKIKPPKEEPIKTQEKPNEPIKDKGKLEAALYELRDLTKTQAQKIEEQNKNFNMLKTELDNAKAEKERAKNYKEFKQHFLDENGEEDYVLIDQYLPQYADRLSRDDGGKLVLKSESGEPLTNKTAKDYAEEVKILIAPGKKSKQKVGPNVKPVSNLDMRKNSTNITPEYIAERKKIINRDENRL